jgi:phosphomannomutase
MNCHWCNGIFEKKSNKSTNQRFCSKDCRYAHWRARNRIKLREVSQEWSKSHPIESRQIKKRWNDKNPDRSKKYYEENKNLINTKLLINYRESTRSREKAKNIVNKLGWIRKCTVEDVQCNGRIELHHIDENPLNNNINNLIYLCRKHHMQRHSLEWKINNGKD